MENVYHFLLNSLGIIGIAYGGPTMILGIMHMSVGTQQAMKQKAMKRVLFGVALVIAGLFTPPGPVNWLPANPVDKEYLNRFA